MHFAVAQTQEAFYISPTGNDRNPGSIGKPFASLQRAQQAIRKWKQTHSQGSLEIILRGGNYFLKEPLTLTASDGGNDRVKILFKSYDGEEAAISGGVAVKGWQRWKGDIFSAPAPKGKFRQLYVNGQRGIRAREPDSGTFSRLKGWDIKNQEILFNIDEVKPWTHFKNVEAVIQMFWAESYVHLSSFTQDGTTARVKINQNEAKILFPRPYPQKQNDASYHFENAVEFLDEPGEWYLDEQAAMVYYQVLPGQDVNSLQFIAPVAETLLDIRGTADNPVRNIGFERIKFEYTNWNLPSFNGFINAQAGMYNLSADSSNNQFLARPAAGVSVAYAHYIHFTSNTFQNMGSTALDIGIGSQYCLVLGNLIRRISGNGIMVGAFTAKPNGECHEPYDPADERELCFQNTVADNYIEFTGEDYFGTCGIAAGYPTEIKIENNVIKDVPYSGISVGYGWTGQKNAMRANIISRNKIVRAMKLLCDGAGVYTLSYQPGTRIFANHIYEIERSPWAGQWPVAAIYLDQDSGGSMENPFIIENNVLNIQAFGVAHYNMHREGIVLYKRNFIYNVDSVANDSGVRPPFRKLIQEKLGIQSDTR